MTAEAKPAAGLPEEPMRYTEQGEEAPGTGVLVFYSDWAELRALATRLQGEVTRKSNQIVMERLQIIEALGGRPSETPLHDRVRALKQEVERLKLVNSLTRTILAGEDISSLPNDFPLDGMAAERMKDLLNTRRELELAERRAEAAEADAGRYRWLRGHFRFANDSMREIWFDPNIDLAGAYGAHDPDELDATIDAAMKEGA